MDPLEKRSVTAPGVFLSSRTSRLFENPSNLDESYGFQNSTSTDDTTTLFANNTDFSSLNESMNLLKIGVPTQVSDSSQPKFESAGYAPRSSSVIYSPTNSFTPAQGSSMPGHAPPMLSPSQVRPLTPRGYNSSNLSGDGVLLPDMLYGFPPYSAPGMPLPRSGQLMPSFDAGYSNNGSNPDASFIPDQPMFLPPSMPFSSSRPNPSPYLGGNMYGSFAASPRSSAAMSDHSHFSQYNASPLGPSNSGLSLHAPFPSSPRHQQAHQQEQLHRGQHQRGSPRHPNPSQGHASNHHHRSGQSPNALYSKHGAQTGGQAGDRSGPKSPRQPLHQVKDSLESPSSSRSSISSAGGGSRTSMSTSPSPFASFNELHGKCLHLARDMEMSKHLVSFVASAPQPDCELVASELTPFIVDLSIHPFAYQVLIKLFERVSSEFLCSVFFPVYRGHIFRLSVHSTGCRIVQKLVLALPSVELKDLLASELEQGVVELIQDSNGNHVLQKIIEACPSGQFVEYLVSVFANPSNTFSFSCHDFGCRIVQRMLERVDLGKLQPLLTEIAKHYSSLIVTPFGNFVLQHLIVHPLSVEMQSHIIESVLLGRIESYGQHRFASNVIERALEHATVELKKRILVEIVSSTSKQGPAVLETLVFNQYGNFVVQRAMDVALEIDPLGTGRSFLSILTPSLPALRKSSHGKHILSRMAKIASAESSLSQKEGTLSSNKNPVIKQDE
jgi:Pumilio-family RNA binding repeat